MKLYNLFGGFNYEIDKGTILNSGRVRSVRALEYFNQSRQKRTSRLKYIGLFSHFFKVITFKDYDRKGLGTILQTIFFKDNQRITKGGV